MLIVVVLLLVHDWLIVSVLYVLFARLEARDVHLLPPVAGEDPPANPCVRVRPVLVAVLHR